MVFYRGCAGCTLIYQRDVSSAVDDNEENTILRIIAETNRLSVVLPQFTRAVIGVIQVRVAELPLSFAKMSKLLDMGVAIVWRAQPLAGYVPPSLPMHSPIKFWLVQMLSDLLRLVSIMHRVRC